MKYPDKYFKHYQLKVTFMLYFGYCLFHVVVCLELTFHVADISGNNFGSIYRIENV